MRAAVAVGGVDEAILAKLRIDGETHEPGFAASGDIESSPGLGTKLAALDDANASRRSLIKILPSGAKSMAHG
jgi:hypothetical protein